MNYKALLVSLLRSIEGMGGYVHVCLCVFPWTGKSLYGSLHMRPKTLSNFLNYSF